MRIRACPAVLVLLAACSGGSGGSNGGPPPPGDTCATRAPLACWSYADTQWTLPLRAPIQLVSCSYSYEGEALSYAWAIESRPAGSTAATLSTGASTATLVADAAGDYVVALQVTDGCGTSTSRHTVQPIEFVPYANAGADRTVAFGDPAPTLVADGSASSDENLDPLVWAWTITAAPAGSTAALVGADTATPHLTPDVPGQYELTLEVSDGRSSDVDTVVLGAYHPAIVATVDPWDVEYSAALDRLVALEYSGTSLFIVNPHDGSQVVVPLAAVGTAVGLSPDGLHAAVSHSGKLSWVDLAAASVDAVLTATQDGGDVVLPGNGLAYVFPRYDISAGIQLVPLDGTAERGGPTAFADASPALKPRANAAGTRIYALHTSSITAYSIAAGTGTASWIIVPTEPSIRAKGYGPWVSPDGARLYTGSGDVYQTSDFARLADSLRLPTDWVGTEGSPLGWIADSAEAGRILVVPGSGESAFRVHDRATLAVLEAHAAPVKVDGQPAFGGVRYAFWKADGTGYYVVLQMWSGGMGIAEY